MIILVVNAGSSSLKFQAVNMPDEKVLISGYFEKIGKPDSFYTVKTNDEKQKKEVSINNMKEAVEYVVKELSNNNIVESLDDIKGIGHRTVHGADKYSDSVVITDEVIEDIIKFTPLAPLHNPANLIGIEEFMKIIPNATHVAVWDTAFHQTMAKTEYMYATPYEWYEKYKIRKYGFHGTSHKYVTERLNEILNKKGNYIICHLGSGASITAIRNGISVDTSMGFTPNAGLIMSTRSGDIDSTLIPYIMEMENITINDVMDKLNKNSGLLGISGVSHDQRDIFKSMEEGNERSILADDMYNKRIVDYIAKYYMFLGNVDAIAFTAGTGERSKETRERVIESLKPIGVLLDQELNQVFAKESIISSKDSKIPVYVIPTDEEIIIARDTFKFL